MIEQVTTCSTCRVFYCLLFIHCVLRRYTYLVMSSQAQKRKHKTLTIKEKCDILDRLNRNESFSSLASEYGVGRSTIYDIKKNHEKIKQFVSTTECGPGKRQTLKKAEHPEVEEAL